MKKGDLVHYEPYPNCPPEKYENGKVKTVPPDVMGGYCFVVFHCAGEWDKYEDYTGQLTKMDKLKPGWVENPAM